MRTELVTTLKRRATALLDRLGTDREAILITQHGVPSAYLVDVESYRFARHGGGEIGRRCAAAAE